jgi:hypothetical protein
MLEPENSTDHEWRDVGFIHEKLVCKHCDIEKMKSTSIYCHERMRMKAREEGRWVYTREDLLLW